MRGVPAIPRRSPRTPLPPVPTGMLASIGKEDGEMWLGGLPELKRPRYSRSLGAAVALLMGKILDGNAERGVTSCVALA